MKSITLIQILLWRRSCWQSASSLHHLAPLPTLNIAFLCNCLKYTGAIAGNHFGLLKYSIKTSPLGRYFKWSYIKIGYVQNILTMQTIGQAQSSSTERQTDQPKHSKAQCLNLLKGKRNPPSLFKTLVYA